jgi:phage gpG-like protein
MGEEFKRKQAMQRAALQRQTEEEQQQPDPARQPGGDLASQMLLMQRTVGNQKVQRMMGQRQVIQRDPTEDVVSTMDPISGTINNIGDFVGNDKAGFNKGTEGGSVSVVGGTLGLVSGGIKTGVKAREWHESNQQLEALDSRRTEEGIYATIAIWERKRAAAIKGTAEGSGSVIGSISGLIGSIAGLAGAQALSAAMSAFGGILGAVTGTIMAVRDFMNVHKRRKAKNAIALVIDSYTQIAADVQNQMNSKLQEVKSVTNSLKTAKPKDRAGLRSQLATLKNELAALETKFDGLDNMRLSLAVAKRKQGFGGKIFSGITNLVGVAGAGALAGLALGGAAAAGPAGWALAGVALAAALGYFIGMKVKKAIRESNVKRMNEEIVLVKEFITSGKVAGTEVTLPNGTKAATLNSQQRKAVTWRREMFPTVEQKGWFNKLFSKSKSGTMTIGARLTELQDYLDKYDKSAAAGTVWEGFKRALAPGEEGDMQVDNPKFDPKQPGSGIPQKITLRESIQQLIEHFLPGKLDDVMKAIAAGGDKEDNTRKLLLQKMKLEDK